MAETTKKFSELGSAASLDGEDIFAISQSDGSGYGSVKTTLLAIATKILKGLNFTSDLITSDKTIIGAINEAAAKPWTDVTGTLSAGETTLTLSDAAITTDSKVEYFTSVFGVEPTAAVVTTGQIVLTFEARQSNLGVTVRVS